MTNDKPAKPKSAPSRHRHLPVAEMLDPGLIDQVVKTTKGKDAETLRMEILGRVGHSLASAERAHRRVDRWNRNRAGKARMPSHLKIAATVLSLADQCVAQKFPEGKGWLGARLPS